jgi:CheY-like chemotaxis protein
VTGYPSSDLRLERGEHMEPRKILVVEDNEESRLIFVWQLRRFGAFDIREATNGQEALEWIMREPPQVVFLDLKMPVMDGWETARRIRALAEPLRQLPIVAVTAQAMPGDREKALAAGCDEYISKPIVDMGEVREKLEWLLTHGRSPSPASAARQD